MKKDGKYRFSLQFPAESESQVNAGELLERLGNRKSSVVVAALNEYLASHPELSAPGVKIHVRVEAGIDRARLEAMIRSIIDERAVTTVNRGDEQDDIDKPANTLDKDIAAMISNLEIFDA